MNILLRLPDDIQEKIYKIIHQDFIKTIKKELWNNLKGHQQEFYITTKYTTEYALYCIYTEHDNLQNPDEIAIRGRCIIFQDLDHVFNTSGYIGDILENLTFGDLLLEADTVIKITEDYHHCFLEGFEIIDNNNGINIIRL